MVKAVGVALLAVVGVAGALGYLEVRTLIDGGTITFEDPQTGEPVHYTPQGAWEYTTREKLTTWLTGRLPSGKASDVEAPPGNPFGDLVDWLRGLAPAPSTTPTTSTGDTGGIVWGSQGPKPAEWSSGL